MANIPRAEPTAEHYRLLEERERIVRWRYWGPYVSERAWGTVREDYSGDGDAWNYFPHEHARSRAYRWNEDGIAGICDRNQILCLAPAFWNGRDRILKERLFGLTGPEGNHGEDVKELYYYEDATPTSSYLRYGYKYLQRPYPYDEIVEASRRAGSDRREIELWDLGYFKDGRYFDITIEYAKRSAQDILMCITAENRGPEAAPLEILPQLWFRNTWAWGDPIGRVPEIREAFREESYVALRAHHDELGTYFLYAQRDPAFLDILFTGNETNTEKLFGVTGRTPWVKDAFHDYIINNQLHRICPEKRGTKAACRFQFLIPAGGRERVMLRLSAEAHERDPFLGAGELLIQRRHEADAFYAHLQGTHISEDRRLIQRQAAAGMLWSMQFYHYDVRSWLSGDLIPPPKQRLRGRNWDWQHLEVADVISMPDKWEYPWFAAWDLAFHALALSSVDIDQAKAQLKLMVKEWYQHPNGQIPAYEWEFSDLNPPVHAWAAYQIYKIERKQRGIGDRVFLERVFHKLLINFAWWVNRRDVDGNSVFDGGFLGLDNISLFDRSEQLPPGVRLEQADATAWMAMYCIDLMRIALELAEKNSAYEDLASKFFEHFLRIAYALHHAEPGSLPPWSEDDGFYFDIVTENGKTKHLPVRSMVGLIPIFAVHVITPETYGKLDNFRRRTEWFLDKHPEFAESITVRPDGRRVLSAVTPERLEKVLAHLFDESKFLSRFGPRSLSKEHESNPAAMWLESGGKGGFLHYEPGESTTRMKGGNSNWRGPVWVPTGYMLYRSLLRLEHGFGDALMIPAVNGSGPRTLRQGAEDLARRMVSMFERDVLGRRPVFGREALFQEDVHFRDRLWFFEYFHAETGEGLGASHQTGWTGLIGDLILRLARSDRYQSGRAVEDE